MIKRENYIVLQGWMISDLGLKGTELVVYATIYGFSQGDDQGFTGGLQYLAEWTGATTRTVISALNTLEKKGLIERSYEIIRGVRIGRLKALCENISLPSEKISPPSEKISHTDVKNFHPESEKISPNNYIYNNSLSISEKESKKKKPDGDPFDDPDLAEDLRDSLHEFEAMRNTIKAPLTAKGKTLILSKLRKLSNNTAEQIEIVNQSIVRSWRGVFPLEEERRTPQKPNDTQKTPGGSFYRIEQHQTTPDDADLERASRERAKNKWND